MKKCISLLMVTLSLAGCSFSKKEEVAQGNTVVTLSSEYSRLKEIVKNESPTAVSAYLDEVQVDLTMEQESELFDLVVNRGSSDVFVLLAKRHAFNSVMARGDFVFRQRAMNLDIRGSLIALLSASLEDTKSLEVKGCAEVLSAVFFLRWAQTRVLQHGFSISDVLENKNCRSVDSKLLSYLFRNELAFLYLNSGSSLDMLEKLASLHEISRKSYLTGSFTWGQLMISPILILRSLPEGSSNQQQLASVYDKIRSGLEASSDIAYYVVARSGSYRVGRLSNPVELVSLEEALISELVQQNADFVFDRAIPVDQDIKLP